MKKHLIKIAVVSTLLLLIGVNIALFLNVIDGEKAITGYKSTTGKALEELASRENENIRLQKNIEVANENIKDIQEALEKLEQEARQNSNADTEAGGRELDQWLGAVRKLRNFIKYHPNYAIPEFKYLTAKEWLAATESGIMKSEADYRAALAELRQGAKLAVSRIFGQAVKDFSNANNGISPSRLSDIINYLPAGFDPGILERYETNPSGVSIDTPSAREQQWIIKEAKPSVDDIWDSEVWVSSSGGIAINDISAVVGGAVESVQSAIVKYENDHGAEPVNVDQISEYINKATKKKTGKDKINKIFQAFMNK